MKKLSLLTILVIASVSGFANDALEDKKVAKVAPKFATLDRNSDGMISKDEAKALTDLSAAFQKYDSDKDEKLSREEYREFTKSFR